MRTVILHNAVPDDAPPEDLDTLVQVDVVAAAIEQLGRQPMKLSCTLDLAAMCDRLREARPEMIFYLVESLAGFDALAHLPAEAIEAIGLPHTGSGAFALALANHKIRAKRLLRQAGLPTPPWIENGNVVREGRAVHEGFEESEELASWPSRSSWILKNLVDQGSRDMEDDAVLCDVAWPELRERLRHRAERLGRPCFAEQFIAGREFVVVLLAGPNGPETLPPSEIEFRDFPADKPRIVGYRAKWRDDCREYHQTPRRFNFDPSDKPLLDQLQALARQCWDLFDLHGWARVDFRIDAEGRPWILEVNANPCLSPDAGFVATLQQASISFPEAIARILNDPA